MLNTLRTRMVRDEGFTLVELLVVILIIGILAAIALPTFLGQQQKAQDASAKSNARNMVSQVESCYADTQNYTQCETSAQLAPSGGSTGLPIGSGSGQVQVNTSGTTSNTYQIDALSKSGVTYTIKKDSAGNIARTCTPTGKGSCVGTGTTGSW